MQHRKPADIARIALACSLSLLTCMGCDPKPTRAPRPARQALAQRPDIRNIIFISIDTLRADHLACYGHPYVRTPHIDALAGEAVLFTQAITAAPTTLASHTSMMTGSYPHTHGVPRNGFVVSDDNLMMAEILKQAGFVTAAFVGAYPLDRDFNFQQGFDHYDCSYQQQKQDGIRDQAQRRAEAVTDAALAWLNKGDGASGAKTNDDRRRFLFVHYFDVHWPYDAPAPYRGMYLPQGAPAVDGSTKGIDELRKLFVSRQDIARAMQWSAAMDAEYSAEATYCDHHVGRLIDGLKARGLWNNALVILTSDHGETMHEHPNVWNHGRSVFDTEIHVPLIVRFPEGRLAGARESRLVSTVDILPTVLHLLDLPENPNIDGESFAGLLDGELPARDPVFAQATQPWDDEIEKDRRWRNRLKAQCIRTDRYKYMYTPANKSRGLYDLRTDPYEQKDLYLAVSQNDPTLAGSMRDRLTAWTDSASPFTSQEVTAPQAVKSLGTLGYTRDGAPDIDDGRPPATQPAPDPLTSQPASGPSQDDVSGE